MLHASCTTTTKTFPPEGFHPFEIYTKFYCTVAILSDHIEHPAAGAHPRIQPDAVALEFELLRFGER